MIATVRKRDGGYYDFAVHLISLPLSFSVMCRMMAPSSSSTSLPTLTVFTRSCTSRRMCAECASTLELHLHHSTVQRRGGAGARINCKAVMYTLR